MGHVFLSYSRRDKEQVDRIVEALISSKIEVWIDRSDIKAGKTWRQQIVEAIDTCEAFILMLSPNSVLSDNVRREIDLALDSGRTILPIRLEPVKLSAEIRYQLTGLQFIDAHELGFDECLRQLLSTLNEELANSRPPEPIRQTELVIEGIDLDTFGEDKRAQLIDYLAKLCNKDQNSFRIVSMARGSVHVFVDMPAESAFKLKTMALNREKRLKLFGITALRITGDRKFVNIALGVLTTTATIGLVQLIWLSLPSLFPSVFGVVTGKLILVTTAVAVATASGVAIVNSVNNPTPLPPTEIPTLTFTPSPFSTGTTPQIPNTGITDTATPEPSPSPTETSTFTPTLTPSPTDTPTDTPTFTPSFTVTPSPTDTPSPTSTPTETPTQTPTPGGSGGFTISNVQLNRSGNSVSVAAGSSVSVTLDYQVWSQPACPRCIDQIVIGLDANPLYCAYHGIPGLYPGQNGSNTNTITAPGTSGTYTIYAVFLQFYTCTDALAAYAPRRGRPIGTITVP